MKGKKNTTAVVLFMPQGLHRLHRRYDCSHESESWTWNWSVINYRILTFACHHSRTWIGRHQFSQSLARMHGYRQPDSHFYMDPVGRSGRRDWRSRVQRLQLKSREKLKNESDNKFNDGFTLSCLWEADVTMYGEERQPERYSQLFVTYGLHLVDVW